MKGLLRLSLLLLLLTSSFLLSGQAVDHVLGEVLFKIKQPASIENIKSSFLQDKNISRHIYDFELVSAPFDIWKLHFDHGQVHERSVLQDIRNHPFVQNAQFNYLTQSRSIPDDPLFSNQWYIQNTGQSGGVYDVDLGLDQAWTETTGGLTYSGDTVVICIIDDVFEFTHQDLEENVWINHGEIPDNGIDDDGNGYTDDYIGWNVSLNNDEVQNTDVSDWHGTAVAGISGAVGNNGKGVSGICWNIKLMLVSRGSTTADAISAYTYPFVNRQKYNETLGEEGTFVVATNSSWGIDFGTPDDAPLWCAMYDSLGSVGILNACATTNLDNNVDEVGDLPTTCGSEFLISTTIVDDHDVKMNAGYGALNIDLGAFGENIYSTFTDNSYNSFNGTSAAAPQVAGGIGLLHTAPCPSFAAMAKNNPELAALQLKDYILNGTVPNESLSGLSVTGGRLNINNSMNLLLEDCDYTGCFSPYAVNIESVSAQSVMISWLVEVATNSVNLRYREVGNSTWILENNTSNEIALENLEACTNYEFQLQSWCETGLSAYTVSFSFVTDGCCHAPQNIEVTPQEESLNLVWDAVTAASSYQVEWRIAGTVDWYSVDAPFANYILDGLENCETYEIRIKTLCSNGQETSTNIFTIITLGCGACLDLQYCLASGPTESLTWIGHFSISDLDHNSGVTSSGYSDFTDQSVNLIQGFIQDFSISSDFEFVLFLGYFHIWIDLNQDGVFSESELLYQSNVAESEQTGNLFIPGSSVLGTTRMRIALLDAPMDACDPYSSFGEVEDFCVNISEPTECLPPVNFNVSASETEATLTWSGNLLIDEYVLKYRAIGTNDWFTENTFANNFTLTNLLPCSDYEYYLSSICEGESSYNGPNLFFLTKGCGTCLDQEYCEYLPCSSDFEWIESIEFGALNFESGNNNGYTHFNGTAVNFQKGETYALNLTPGFSNDFYDEFFTVWIDYNQDGEFGLSSELVLNELSTNGDAVSTIVTIPTNAVSGSTRMRVSMKYNDAISSACESGFDGEIEEYCIDIYEDVSSEPCGVPTYLVTNPIDSFTVEANSAELGNAISYRFRHRLLEPENQPWELVSSAFPTVVLEIDSCGDREVQVQAICVLGISEFTESQIINSCEQITSSTVVIPAAENVMEVFPNPFSESTTLFFELESSGEIEVEVYSITGQRENVFSYSAPKGSSQLGLGFQESGLYVLKVFKDRQPFGVKKVIKLN